MGRKIFFQQPVKGAHNLHAILAAKQRENFKIIKETPGHPPGITTYEYKVIARRSDKSIIRDSEGNITYKTPKVSLKKTVYDPALFSDQTIYDLGRKAAADGYHAAMARGDRNYTATAGGVTFQVYTDKLTHVITNFIRNSASCLFCVPLVFE